MTHAAPAYGLWSLVVINIAIFGIFAYSFTRPRTARDWRAFGAFSGFLVALFVEMYGFPLTIYLLSGWLQRRYPGLDLLSHDAGHLWETLLAWQGNPHLVHRVHRHHARVPAAVADAAHAHHVSGPHVGLCAVGETRGAGAASGVR